MTCCLQIGDAEDKRLAELNLSLNAVYDALNEKFAVPRSASTFGQIRATLKVWRALRRSTDPSTKDFLVAMERIRRDYDRGIMALTDAVQPLTEEEVRLGFERAGGKEIQRAIEEGVDTAFEMQHAIEDAVQKSLQPLNRQVAAVESRHSGAVTRFDVVDCCSVGSDSVRRGAPRGARNHLDRRVVMERAVWCVVWIGACPAWPASVGMVWRGVVRWVG
jgi:hypothetical protein